MRGDTERRGEREIGRASASPQVFAVVEIAAAHERDAGRFGRAAVVVREAETVPEFVREAAEIPRVELRHGSSGRHRRTILIARGK